MSTWTVVGLRDGDSGELLVAGVLEGEHPARDSGPLSGRFGRYCTFVQADTADQAERLACAAVDGDALGDVDEAAVSPEPLWPALVCAGPDMFQADR
jgi:hypothetical protein